MELYSFAMDVMHTTAELLVSYKPGQVVLRQLDRVLWVVEKSARWAVPPPLDQDEKPQPDLVRPLPWVLFLMLLAVLRLTRESISLVNLVMGKPPLRSADVVMYIQGKRRYLRTLKYTGVRAMRARNVNEPSPWRERVLSLLQYTMCYRQTSSHKSQNVMVVKRNKKTREPTTADDASESNMERLIEKMMGDLDADSDDDSSYTLTNATSLKSDTDESNSEPDTVLKNDNSAVVVSSTSVHTDEVTISTSSVKKGNVASSMPDVTSSTPIKECEVASLTPLPDDSSIQESDGSCNDLNGNAQVTQENYADDTKTEEVKGREIPVRKSLKQESQNFIKNERCSPTKKTTKIANGRARNVSSKNKGGLSEGISETPVAVSSAERS